MPRNDTIGLGELTDSTFYILLALTEPRHGYLIMQFVEELTNGRVQIGPASMYTIIKKLVNASLIEPLDGDGKKKSYIITDIGRALLHEDVKRRQAMVDDARFIMEGEGHR
ncbi:PadR family transcriptional regulator [Exiguobacterium sp. SH31]|uniref:PadR family transcriptional regulator n=1 Tax=unclassified Exiguobacterium TaxID=2644629 RepID=UPI0008C6BC97|nr:MULTISPECIES: PadR family transcriptional regulator [unclassified Exiguobacterium]OGX79444.1 PadR family transcriptional regulator [Exiguobacterium sp. SH31]TCI70461.1 PadR family transcriptional regulator [Exiguobacterium sp. SH0S7]